MTCWLCGFQTTKAPVCNKGPCKICIAIADVDEEINQVEATLRRLITKRCGLLSDRNRVHDPLMHQLPVELKNHIFELILPSRNEWGEILPLEKPSSFLDSISVCREWRDLALSNPFLWSTVHIPLETSGSSNRINSWILRSGTLPLTLHLQGTYEQEQLNRLASILSHCSDRLQSLSLNVPFYTLKHNGFQYRRLTRLRISSNYYLDRPLPLLNQTASPEKIELYRVSFRMLQILWHRLTSATVSYFDLEDATLLFQNAPQMTCCRIFSLRLGAENFSVPPIIHHKLKTLELHNTEIWDVPLELIGSLTLPCLQEFYTDETVLLTRLPALVHRSSCPFTKITIEHICQDEFPFDEYQPLSGVTNLVVENLDLGPELIKRLLLEGYFPDLRHLTLRLDAFQVLWASGDIPLLLDLKRPRGDEPNEGKLHQFLVVDKDQALAFKQMWNSDDGGKLKKLNISLREDGFEFL